MSRFLIFMSLFCLAGSVQAETAPQPPAKRTILQRADVDTISAQETIFGKVEILPGSGNGFHTHNGSEMGYVLEGHIRLEVKGQPSRDLGPGDSFLIPRGVVHRSVLLGTVPVRLISTWTVDKDKPLLNLVPDQ